MMKVVSKILNVEKINNLISLETRQNKHNNIVAHNIFSQITKMKLMIDLKLHKYVI